MAEYGEPIAEEDVLAIDGAEALDREGRGSGAWVVVAGGEPGREGNPGF